MTVFKGVAAVVVGTAAELRGSVGAAMAVGFNSANEAFET